MTKLPYKAVIQNILQCNANSILLANKQTQNRIESLEINPCMYINWSLTTIHDEERVALFNKWSWKTKFKRMKLKPHLILHTKVNSKWIKDWIVRPETTKLLEENIGSKLRDIILGGDFFEFDSKNNGNKSTSKWDCINLKDFCTGEETINKMERQPSEWEKTLIDQYPKCIQNSHSSTGKKQAVWV